MGYKKYIGIGLIVVAVGYILYKYFYTKTVKPQGTTVIDATPPQGFVNAQNEYVQAEGETNSYGHAVQAGANYVNINGHLRPIR
jgi:uncharacterized membrane protein YukC